MKSHLLCLLTLLVFYALAESSESSLILRDCSQNIRRTVSKSDSNFTVRVKLLYPSQKLVIAKSKDGGLFTAPIQNSTATFSELTPGDWIFCSDEIESISYSANDSLLLAGLTGASALAAVVSFSGTAGGETSSGGLSLESTEPLSLEAGNETGSTFSPPPASASGESSSANFAKECLNEQEIEVMSRMS